MGHELVALTGLRSVKGWAELEGLRCPSLATFIRLFIYLR